MNRRDFLKTSGLAVGSFALKGCASDYVTSPGGRSRRPNIVFIMSDDHAVQAMSCYGSKINKTPNLDRIANEGMRFDNCFCTNSICTPSRATILTGKYSHKNGCLTLSDKFDGAQQTFPKLLQQAGYYTAVIGKWHLKTEPTGFDYWNVLPGQGDYFDPKMTEMGRKQRYTGYVTDVITNLALAFLKNRPKDKPFCLLYHHKAPHDMWEYDKKHAHLYQHVDIPEPDNLFDDYSNRGEAIKRATQKIGTEETVFLHDTQGGQFDDVREKIAHLPAEQKKRRAYQYFIKAYLRCVASIDDNVGRVLNYLDETGLRNNTVVIYTSDQGFFLGEHGLFDKRFMYEESLRMPLIVRYPPEIKAGSVSDYIVLNVDFAETFLDYAGAAVPGDMQGRSLRPLLRSQTPKDWRTTMYYRYWMHGAHFNVAGHFGVRTKRYKLIYYYGLPLNASGAKRRPTPPEWELFDLQKDPREMNNVYHDRAHKGVVKELKAELVRLRRELEDDNDAVVINLEIVCD
ncbi:MAG: sulfatase-like hydrolase/transferase [Planctomycetota bacterium]|jgi:arylsulfatase A-like enzyme